MHIVLNMYIPILFALAGALCWAVSPIISKIALRDTDVSVFATIRMLSGLLFIILYGIFTGGFVFSSVELASVAALGGILDPFIGVIIFLYALKRMKVYKAGPLVSTAPFWGVLSAVLFLGEEPRLLLFLVAFIMAVGGYFLVSGEKTRIDAREVWKWALLIVLVSSFLYGFAEAVPCKYALTGGMSILTFQLIFVLAGTIPWGMMLCVDRIKKKLSYSRRGIGFGVLDGFSMFFIGWFLWLSAIEAAPASVIAPVRGSVVLFTFLLSILLLGERPTKKNSLGMFAIVAGVVLVTFC